MTKSWALAPILFVVLQQPECSLGTMVQGKAVEGIRQYFPDAEAMSVLPCTLSIETHVDNVSRKLITELAHRLFQSQEMRELAAWMEFSGYNYFVLGFTHHTIVLDRYRSVYYVFDSAETARFFQSPAGRNFYCVPR